MGVTAKQKGRMYMWDVLPREIKYTADGPIGLFSHLGIITKGSACLLTLGVPTGLPNGTELEIRSQTAFAHVVTATGGFGGTGATRDAATFLAEVGAGFQAIVINSLWHLRAAPNLVTVA